MSPRESRRLLDFCVLAQRIGGSQRLAWRQWERYSPGCDWDRFCVSWTAARASVELAARLLEP